VRERHVTIPVTVKVTQGRCEIVGNTEVAHGATRSLHAGNALKWSGATHFCTRFRGQSESWVAPDHTFAAKRDARRRGIGMLLAIQKSYEHLAKYGCFAREICDKCGTVLGAVRYTRKDESGVWCSGECRGDVLRSVRLKPGRPRKYKNADQRRAAKTRQQQDYRLRFGVEKTVCIQSETKELQTQESLLSTIPLTRPLPTRKQRPRKCVSVSA